VISIGEVLRLHGVPQSIVSDRDPSFTAHSWKVSMLGTKLKFSMTYHPKTGGQSERTIPTMEELLRNCAMDFEAP
ncbi:Transposon Ty3-G Gag-Pol polyprotein, partial [Linum perenne]